MSVFARSPLKKILSPAASSSFARLVAVAAAAAVVIFVVVVAVVVVAIVVVVVVLFAARLCRERPQKKFLVLNGHSRKHVVSSPSAAASRRLSRRVASRSQKNAKTRRATQ